MDASCKRIVKLLSLLLAFVLLLGSIPAALAESAADGFTLVLNPDGKTSITAGQQGEYPVYALLLITSHATD